MTDKPVTRQDAPDVEGILRAELDDTEESRAKRVFKKFITAALGSAPWVGPFLSAAADLYDDETGQRKVNELYRRWFEEHSNRLNRLARALHEIASRLDRFGDDVESRVQSEGFLAIVRKAFRSWDQADTEEKRQLLQKLLTKAGATKLCPDDLVRLFIDWIDRYHETHFKVIRVVYQHPGSTRAAIWQEIYGDPPREDSAEADLFKLLIRDLSLGSVIRQERATTADGRYLKKNPLARKPLPTPVMKSAFDDGEPYVLTELGRQFVHYTMDEVVPKLDADHHRS